MTKISIYTECSSVWPERRLREAKVAGSNPVTPIASLCFSKYGHLGHFGRDDGQSFWQFDNEFGLGIIE